VLITIKCPNCGDIAPREIDAEHPLTCFACTRKLWPPFYVTKDGAKHVYADFFHTWEVTDGVWERRNLIDGNHNH
jgi:hypothetical protein